MPGEAPAYERNNVRREAAVKRYELVKYRYGLKPHTSTAFSLVPVAANGKRDRRHTRHFQTPEAAKAYLGSIGAEIVDADWAELPGTAIAGVRQVSEKRLKPVQLNLEVA